MGPGALPGRSSYQLELGAIPEIGAYQHQNDNSPPGAFSNNIAGPAGIMSSSSGGGRVTMYRIVVI